MPQKIHGLLGLPVFETDMYIPEYKNAVDKNWRISQMGLGFDHGYISDVWAVENMSVLSKRDPENSDVWYSWMSICPHEIESQELCCLYAKGHTVIMGPGMCWVAINTAMNKQVTKVTVIENDREVIDLFHHSGALDGLSEEIISKIEVIYHDALTWKSDGPQVDFLYVDIWLSLAEPSTFDDLQRIQNNLSADTIYFWGQELMIYTQYKQSSPDMEAINEQAVTYCVNEIIKMPLLIPDDSDYSGMINKAIEQRKKRRLPLKRD